MADNVKTNLNKGNEAAQGGNRPGGTDAFNRGNAGGTNGGAGNQGNTGGGSTADSLRDSAQAVVDKAGDYAHQAREKLGDYAGQARDAIGDWTGQAGERVQRWAGEAYDVASDQVGDFGREVSTLVRRHPIPALLIGFGVGVLLGRAARMV